MTIPRLPMAALFVSVALPASADMPFQVINNSDLTLMEFYISPVSDGSWGEDLLTVHVLPSGAAETIALVDLDGQCSYQLRFVLENGKDILDTANICQVSRYTVEKPE